MRQKLTKKKLMLGLSTIFVVILTATYFCSRAQLSLVAETTINNQIDLVPLNGASLFDLTMDAKNFVDTQQLFSKFLPQDTSPKKSAPTEAESHLKAKLKIERIDQDKIGFRLRFSLSDVNLDLSQMGLLRQDHPIVLGLRGGALANFYANGLLKSLEFDANLNSVAKTILVTLISELQFQLPNNNTEFKREEIDGQGKAEVAYSQAAQSNVLVLRKQKLSYKSLDVIQDLKSEKADIIISPNSVSEFIFSKKTNRLESFSSNQGFEVKLDSNVVYRSHLKFALRGVSRTTKSALVSTATKNVLTWKSSSFRNHMSQIALNESYRREAANYNIQTLKSEIIKASSRDDEMLTYRKLKAFLIANPDASKDFLIEIVNATYGSMTQSIVPVALASAGHVEGQRVLAQAIKDRMAQKKDILKFIPLLASSQGMTVETMKFIEGLNQTSDLPTLERNTAKLALGSAARIYRSQNSQDYDPALQTALTQLEGKDRAIAIQALGNLGDDRSVPKLVEIAANKTELSEIRAEAVYSLRFVEGISALSELQRFTQDSDATLRIAAFKALQYQNQDPRTLEISAQALRNNQEIEEVQVEVIRLVKMKFEHESLAKTLMAEISQSGKNLRVKGLARQYSRQ